MTVNPLESSDVYTFTSYNFSFSSSVVKLEFRVSMAHDWSPRETSPGPIQRSKLHAELKVQPTTGPHCLISRLIFGRFGSLKVHLMDTLSRIRIRPQLQDTIRWATSFGVYFGVHLWWFIWVFREQPDVMRIVIITHLMITISETGRVHAFWSKFANALMRVCQYRIGTSWWETSCNWLRTRQEPACYLWPMCALFMIINVEVERNPLSLSLIGCILESTSAMYGSPQTVLCWFCESQVLGI